MSVFTVEDAQPWAETSKLTVDALETPLAEAVKNHVIGRLAVVYSTTAWSDSSATPRLVRSIMGMYYVAWLYERQHSEDDPSSEYSLRLLGMAERALESIIDGSTVLVDVLEEDQPSSHGPASVAVLPDPSFSMGQVF